MRSIGLAGREGTVDWCWGFPREADKLTNLPEKDNGCDVLGNRVGILNFVKDYANCEMVWDWLYIVYRVVEESVQHMQVAGKLCIEYF